MIFKSKFRWIALVGLVLSVLSLVTHLLLANYSTADLVQYTPILTIFNWRPVVESEEFPHRVNNQSSHYRKLWGPIKSLESLQPYANPRGKYPGGKPSRAELLCFYDNPGRFAVMGASVAIKTHLSEASLVSGYKNTFDVRVHLV